MPASMPLSLVVLEVLRHTPQWVWGVLALLVVLGSLQLRMHRLPGWRVLMQPLALGAYSLWGASSTFGTGPLVLASWLAGAALFTRTGAALGLPHGVRHDAMQDRFEVPGSAVPLLLMLGVFVQRYAVAVTLVFHPAWRSEALCIGVAAFAYGAFSGLFAGRALVIRRSAGAAPRWAAA